MPWLIAIPVVLVAGLGFWLYERHKAAAAAVTTAPPATPPTGMPIGMSMPMGPAPSAAPAPPLVYKKAGVGPISFVHPSATPAPAPSQGKTFVLHFPSTGQTAKITPGPQGPPLFPPQPSQAQAPTPPVGVPAPPFNLAYPGTGAWSNNSAYITQYQGALKYLSWAVGQVGSQTDRVAAPSFNPGTVDGSYGNATKTAVMAFQAWAGLPQDGQAGEATVVALAQKVAQYTQLLAQSGPLPPVPAPPGGSGKTGGNYTLQAGGVANLSAAVWFFDLPPGGNQWAPNAMSGSYSPTLLGNQAILDTKGVPGSFTFAWTTPDGSSTQSMVVNFS